MSHTDNLFESFPDLDEATIEKGHTLSNAQRMVIKNLIAGYAHEHLQIKYDCERPHDAAMQQQYIKGAIDALTHLLFSHDELTQAREDAARNSDSANF